MEFYIGLIYWPLRALQCIELSTRSSASSNSRRQVRVSAVYRFNSTSIFIDATEFLGQYRRPIAAYRRQDASRRVPDVFT